MKNRFLPLFFLFVILSFQTKAQDVNTTLPDLSSTDFNSIDQIAQLSSEIIKAAGKKANFVIRKANVPNAAAVLYGDKRYILYNPDFIERLTLVTGTKWAAISVLAHEIGHHLNRESANGNISLMSTELQADEFSGFVLQRMGATLREAQAAIKVLGSTKATRTHPAIDDRLNIIAKGYAKAGGYSNEEIITKSDSDIRITMDRSVPLLDTKNILAEINFTADPQTKYYITSRFNVVKISRNKLYMVGTMSRLDNKDYPFVMYDADKTPLFVNSRGTIVNRKEGVVGNLLESADKLN